MTTISFRNLDLNPSTPPSAWPAEAIQTVIERGSLTDWRVLAGEIRRSPWGRVARVVEQVTSWAENPGVDDVLARVVSAARQDVVDRGRQRWADHLRKLRTATGLSMRAFAALAGTSASRLSDYENARVAPTTDVVARLEHAADIAASGSSDPV